MENQSEDSDFPLQEMDDNGVDLSQIRYRLGLAPTARVRYLQVVLMSANKLRQAFLEGLARPNPPLSR